jgi:polysaccharide biosynthesis/export protein
VRRVAAFLAMLLAGAALLPAAAARAQVVPASAQAVEPEPLPPVGAVPGERDVLAMPRRGEPAGAVGVAGGPFATGSDETATSGMLSLQGGSSPVLSGPVDPDVYVLGPGDVLLLNIWGRVTRSLPIEIGPEGNTLVPGAGPLDVTGRTLREVRSEILRRMGQQYRGVNMELRLARPRRFRLYLTGQVQRPGPIEATGTLRLGDVLAEGALRGGASHRNIEVMRANGSRVPGDLQLFLQTGDPAMNPWLRDGDVIHVPNATRFVYAQGAIARPGRYELGVCDSLSTLLRLAGDVLPSAVIDRVLLVRFRDATTPESLWVDLADVRSGRSNPLLEDGQRMYVYFVPDYHRQDEAVILGEVQRPGTYPIVEGRTRLSDLVAAAASFRPEADLSAIRVHHRSSFVADKDPEMDRLARLSRGELTNSEYEVLRTKLAGLREDYRVDWALLQSDQGLDVLLRDGDVVRVEPRGASIRVDGEVRRPGLVNFVPGRGVRDYVAQAGGFTNRAWRGRVRITRAVSGQTLLARNVRTLGPGDFVWVPEKSDVTIWDQSRETLTALAQIATVIIAIRSVR